MEWSEDKKDDTPYLHVWLRLGQIKEIYTLEGNKKKIKVTVDDLEGLDGDRWVEIPDDYLKTQLDELLSVKESTPTPRAGDADADADAMPTESIGGDGDAAEDDDAGTPDDAPADAPATAGGDEDKKNEFIIVVERKQEDEDAPWPRANIKGDDWRENIETGDILDCKDDQEKWYESVVRRVYPEGHDNFGKMCVHYIGWNVKWDEVCVFVVYI